MLALRVMSTHSGSKQIAQSTRNHIEGANSMNTETKATIRNTIISLIICTWIYLGESQARYIDYALGISATECAKPDNPNAIIAGGLILRMNLSELLYIKIRNDIIKDCN